MTSEQKILDVRKVRVSTTGKGDRFYMTVLPIEWIRKQGIDKQEQAHLLVKEEDNKIILEKIS